ncbi:MAG: malonyl-ACP O-methyltransferase BioC [Thiomargarita sp.]|nr:malonyl-ACP O-methyltransferase BioC [Thiomargarita sp.]
MQQIPEYLDSKKVSQSFNQAATDYDQWSRLQKLVENDLLERLQWLKIDPKSILDVGTGTGRLVFNLSQCYSQANIYGIDIAYNMLQLAAQKTPTGCFIHADAMQLPVADNSIDLIMCNMMLQWCNDIKSIFIEFKRVLKPDGALFFSTLGPDSLYELRNSWKQVDDLLHVNHFIDMHHYGDMLLEVGLCNPVIDVNRIEFRYKNVQQLMRELKKIGAHNLVAGRSKSLMGKNKLRKMLSAYEKYQTTDNLFPATYEVVYGHTLGKQILEPELLEQPILFKH